MRHNFAVIAVPALLAASAALHAQSGEEAQELEPITVNPQVNPLDESMERLRRMMADYCDGCPPLISIPFKEDWTETVAKWFVPPNPSFEERLESRVAGDWRMYERDPNWDY